MSRLGVTKMEKKQREIVVPKLDQGYTGHLWVTPAMRRIADALPERLDVTLKVGLVDAGYWYVPKPGDAVGAFGWVGCTGMTSSGLPPPTTPYDEKDMLLSITFTTTTPHYNRLIDIIFPNLKLTCRPRDGSCYTAIRSDAIPEQDRVSYGLYKKSCFDLIYGVMLDNGVVGGIDEFIEYGVESGDGQYNTDWVEEKEYTGPEGCLQRFDKTISRDGDTRRVSIILYNVDIDANRDIVAGYLCGMP